MPKLALGTLLLACVITLTACGNEDNGVTPEEQFTQLMQRPTEEQVAEQYDQMRQEIADKLSTAVDLPAWTLDETTGGEALCGHEFNDLGVDAGTKSLPLLVAAAPISDDQWDQAIQIAEAIARDNGFGPPQRIVDRAGQHTVDFKDKWGGLLGIDSGAHTVLSVRTGCLLTEEAQQRGTPTPQPEH
ncbi:LppA family lipoprotein [Actinophytocola sediminis]